MKREEMQNIKNLKNYPEWKYMLEYLQNMHDKHIYNLRCAKYENVSEIEIDRSIAKILETIINIVE